MIESVLGVLGAPREGGSGATIFLVQLVLLGGIFYFLLIRPQRKEQQRHLAMIRAVGRGAEIVTSGGIVGKVVEASEDRVTIESGTSRLVIERGRIQRVLSGPGAEGAAPAAAPARAEAPADRRRKS